MDSAESRRVEKRLTLLHDKQWCKTISELKDLKVEHKKYSYSVTYKKINERKEKKLYFNSIQYVSENKSFIFTMFNSDEDTDELTENARNKEVLYDVDIIGYNIDEINDFVFSCN